MTYLNMGAALAAALFTAAPGYAAIIQTGYYAPGLTAIQGSVDLGVGRYRFDVSLSAPITQVFGYVEKQVFTTFFCIDLEVRPDEFECGGNNVPIQPMFEQMSATRWSAFLTVAPPTSYIISPDLRGEDFDVCCTYVFDIEADEPGRFEFSYALVPEPSSWSLMLVAFALAGAALRHRRASPRPVSGAAWPATSGTRRTLASPVWVR